MMQILKQLFGLGPKTDYQALIKEGAIILDVRTPGEYSSGHIKGSVNIPLDQLSNRLSKIGSREKPVITCCASGMRSASAKSFLQSKGYARVYNGGGWQSLRNKL